MNVFGFYESPMGRMLIVANERGLAGLYFLGQKYCVRVGEDWRLDQENEIVRRTARQMAQYFDGKLKEFDLPLAPKGTAFQSAVWNAISSVKYGETVTYSELARRAGHPDGIRAAGTATGRNPITIIVPCHRIIGSDGSLTGYAGGLERKRALQALESGTRSLFESRNEGSIAR